MVEGDRRCAGVVLQHLFGPGRVVTLEAGRIRRVVERDLETKEQEALPVGRANRGSPVSTAEVHRGAVVSLALVSGFGNFTIPLHVGADDMAYPFLNMLSYWTIVPSALLMLASFFVPVKGIYPAH